MGEIKRKLKMRKLLAGSAVCALATWIAAPVSAADLRMPLKAAACPICDWNGLYVGFNLGGSQDFSRTTDVWNWFTTYPAGTHINESNLTGPATFATTFQNQYRHNSLGFIGGLQWGYNWQVGSLLFGLEGDWSWSNEKDTVTYSAQPIAGSNGSNFQIPATTQGWSGEEKVDWLTTWRARLGWAHDYSLWYVTGGVAWAKVETNYGLFSSPGASGAPTGVGGQWGLPGGAAGASFSTIKTGWVLGGGVETAIGKVFGWGGSSNWTMKLEYLFVDLGNVSNTIATGLVPVCANTCGNPATGNSSFTGTNHLYEQIIRLGVNYKLNTVATASSGSAANLRLPLKAAACPSCDWNGLYVGFNLGGSQDFSRTTDVWNWFTTYPAGTNFGVGGGINEKFPTPTTFVTTFQDQYRHNSLGLIGGLQWGYNWQVGSLLFGLEGDWSWGNEKDTVTYSAQPVAGVFPPLGNFFSIPGTTQGWTSEEKIDWLTTWRVRLGWARDCYLWYVTGGVAWAKVEANYSLFSSPGVTGDPNSSVGGQWGLPGGAAGASFSTIKTGWVLGGGVETAIGKVLGWGGSSNWTMKLEYLFVDLGNVGNTIATALVPVCTNSCSLGTGNTSFTSANHLYEQIIRVGVNYKFSTAVITSVRK